MVKKDIMDILDGLADDAKVDILVNQYIPSALYSSGKTKVSEIADITGYCVANGHLTLSCAICV